MSDSGNKSFYSQSLDSINSILSIKNEKEMSQKISSNIPKIFNIFNTFKNKIFYNNQVSKNDVNLVMEALKFVDNLNLFMEENDVKNFKEKMGDIKDILYKKNYYDFKETVTGQISYTEMTIINHKNSIYRNMYFNNHKELSEEIEKELDLVNKGNKFEFKLFKQLQNIFWVVKNVIDDKKKMELENRLNILKNICKKMKEKTRHSNRGYSNYDDYEYTDYKNYSGTYDYNDNFFNNRKDDYYNNKQLKYDDYNNYETMGSNKYYHPRNDYKKNFNNFNNYKINSNRKYYPKKQQEEKEVEIPSDPSYYNNDKINEENLKEENNNNIYNESTNNNNFNNNENNNINGGNDINNIDNNMNNMNNEDNNNINNNCNGGIREDPNSNIDQRINIENNGGNGENINNINNNSSNINSANDVEIITENINLTQNNSGNYNIKQKKLFHNKMMPIEVTESEDIKENNIIINESDNNAANNIRENIEENNNGAKIENNNINNINNIEDNNFINNNNNGNENPEIRQNNNNFTKSHPNTYYSNYNNKGYKQNIYNKNNYHNNHYNRYGIQNNININNSNRKYYRKSPNKKMDFVEIDENNNAVQNTEKQSEPFDLVNGQENENINNDNINNQNGEVLNEGINNDNINNFNNNLEPEQHNNEFGNDLNTNNENLEMKNHEEDYNNKNETKINDINNNINLNEVNGEEKNQNTINDNINININNDINSNDNVDNNIPLPLSTNDENKDNINYMEPNQEEDQKEQLIDNNNHDIDNDNDNAFINDDNMNNLNNNDDDYNIKEIDEEDNINNQESDDDEDLNKYKGDFNVFMIEALGHEPKGDYCIKVNSSDEKEDDEKIEDNNNFDENDLDDAIQDDIENEKLIGMNDEEKAVELKVRELLKKLNIHQIIIDAEKEVEQEYLESEMNKKEKNIKNNNNEEIKENSNNNIINIKENSDSNAHNNSNKYLDDMKNIDPKLRDKIKDQLKSNYNNFKVQEILAPKYTFYKNNLFKDNSQMFSKEFLQNVDSIKKIPNYNAPFSLEFYIFSKMNMLPSSKDNEIFINYTHYKCLEIENPEKIWNNMQNFEKKILIPLYQRIIDNRNKRYSTLEYIYKLYVKAIYNSIPNSKDVIEKVQKYGSFHNTFMVDYGDTDIDICIVPKISLGDFSSEYLDKIRKGLYHSKLGVIKNEINTSSYILLKIKHTYSNSNNKGKMNEINIDISIHNMLPIYNTYLIRLYGLFDQRFHIMGIYLKYWAKINNIHGARENYLSSYALLIMMIHFLQKIVEPKILPNLQKIPINNDYSNPIYGEQIYEYDYNGKLIRTNLYFEKEVNKIKEYMLKINDGKVNDETVTNLLVKFFEYYAYFYDSKQKISVHKDLKDSIKENEKDDIAFSIDDPFETTHNPGKSMIKNTENHKKFVTAMKREVNFILGGEYVKRLEREKKIRSTTANAKNLS